MQALSGCGNWCNRIATDSTLMISTPWRFRRSWLEYVSFGFSEVIKGMKSAREGVVTGAWVEQTFNSLANAHESGYRNNKPLCNLQRAPERDYQGEWEGPYQTQEPWLRKHKEEGGGRLYRGNELLGHHTSGLLYKKTSYLRLPRKTCVPISF